MSLHKSVLELFEVLSKNSVLQTENAVVKKGQRKQKQKKAINKKQQQKKYLSEKLMGICSIVITMNSLFLTLALTDFLSFD